MAENMNHAMFYNSENHDRVYDADSFSDWLRKFFTTGVFIGELQVEAGEGMKVTVNPGYCNIDGKVMFWRQQTPLDITTANSRYDRIDTIVAERNDADRDFFLKVITGSATDSPQPTAPVRENEIYQLVLAQISVRAGVTEITQADITDTRPDSALCGYVAATVKEMDFSQFSAQFDQWVKEYKASKIADVDEWTEEHENDFNQWESDTKDQVLAWYQAMQGQISEDAAVKLYNQITDEELQRIFAAGFADGTKTISEDGLTIDATSEAGMNLHSTFTEDGLQKTSVLKDSGSTEIAKQVKTFSEDGLTITSVITKTPKK